MLELRPAAPTDLPLLRALLVEAAFWRPAGARPSLAQALADPQLARYVEGFGRTGDFGVVAVEKTRPVGAVWSRYFTAEAPGYGFVDETVPELTVAVDSGHRRQGLGAALLQEILRQARARGIARISLSVERDNPSLVLYERLGFRRSASVGNGWTMVAEPECSQCPSKLLRGST